MRYGKVLCLLGLGVVSLTGCGDSGVENSQAKKICFEKGLKPGTADYDHCVSEEASAARIQGLHDEYDADQREKELYRDLHR